MQDLWFSGLRAEARRPITREDVLVLNDLRRDRMSRVLLGLTGPTAIVVLGCVIAVLSGSGEPIVLATMAAGFFVVALRPWRTVPALLRQLASLSRDLQAGEVLVCKGLGRDLVFTFSVEQRLEPAVLVSGSRDQSLEIELTSESGAVISVNGQRVRSWSETTRGTTAVKSEHGRLASQFVGKHPEHSEIGVGERSLSSDEHDELLAHASPLSPMDRSLLAALLALVAISWWYAIASKASNLAVPIMSVVSFVWLAVRSLRRWRIHRRFAADLRYGRVAIVTSQEDASVVEFLPFSGFVWSENHVAAPWRRLPLAQRTFFRRSGSA